MFSKNLFSREYFLVLCWALYDLANQFFALNVISVYFPRWLTLEKNTPEIFYSIAFAVSMILVGAAAPVLGTISDKQRRRKPYLIFFTLLSILFTFLIGVFDHLFVVLFFFVIANLGCQMGIVFYNAMIVNVASREKLGIVSGLGRMFGYCGAILAMYFSKPIIANHGYEATFFMTAAAFLVFSLPALIFIPEDKDPEAKPLRYFLTKEHIRPILMKIKDAFSTGAQYAAIRQFLFMFFFAMCAVQTLLLFMAVYAGAVFNLSEAEIINLIVVSTFFAIIGSLVSGLLADRVGNKRMMMAIMVLWFLGILAGALLNRPFHWLIGSLIGFVLSSTWVVGRAWAARLVPPENIGEIFGLFNLMGYIAGVIGPMLWGIMLLVFSPLGVLRYRLSLLSMLIFIVLAIAFLLKIPKEHATQA